MPGPKPKSAVTPIKTVRNYADGLHRIERRIRKLLQRHGADPDTAGLAYDLTDQYLRLGREVRDTALFDVRIRRELAECQDAELRVMTDEALRKMLEGMQRRAGFRKVSRIKSAAVERLTPVLGAETARATVDRIIDDVPELDPQMTPSTLMRQADKRVEADLDAVRRDVDEALACVEGDPELDGGGDQGFAAEAPLDGGE
jgi:hypothetical protein